MKDRALGELAIVETDHCCPLNFKGSSKSMEARTAVSMVTSIFEVGGGFI